MNVHIGVPMLVCLILESVQEDCTPIYIPKEPIRCAIILVVCSHVNAHLGVGIHFHFLPCKMAFTFSGLAQQAFSGPFFDSSAHCEMASGVCK